MMVWKRWLRLVWAVMGCSRRIPVENCSYCTWCGWSSISQSRVCIYESLYIYIYCWRQKCLEPRIIYIYLCMNTCLHTHEMQMYLYDVKFESITAYISPPVLHTNCFIASSAQIWGGFFRSEANEQPGVSRSSRGHTFHFPRDGWMTEGGKKVVWKIHGSRSCEKKRPDFQGFLQQTSLVCLGLVSYMCQHMFNMNWM